MAVGNYTTFIIYNELGEAVGFSIDDGTDIKVYYYMKDITGQIDAVVDVETNTIIYSCTYDAWGYILDEYCTDALVAYGNPLRYKGYNYDVNSDLYYLQSRYYDAAMGRFLNADDPTLTDTDSMTALSTNMYAYCENDSVNAIDPTGYLSKIDAAIYLVTFIVYFVAPILLKDKAGKYTFETSKIVIDKTGLCLAKIKYYKSKWNKKTFQVVLGGKKDWANRTNINNNLNMTAINYHANNINSIMSKSGTGKFTKSDAIQANIYSFYIACYLINAGIKTAKVKYQYDLLWGKYTGRFAYSKANVILSCIFKGGSLNGWYYFC